MRVREASEKEIRVLWSDLDPSKVLLATVADGGDGGIVVAKDLFDAEMLQMKIARVLAVRSASSSTLELLYREVIAKLDNLGFDQVIRRVDAKDLHEIWTLEHAGFQLMDVGLTFSRRIYGPIPAPEYEDLIVRASTDDDMRKIAPAIVGDPWGSRYDCDPFYRPENVRELRIQWLWNSHRTRADVVLVGEIDARPAGYVTCLIEPASGDGEVELVGTLPEFRGQHVASRILEHAMAWFSTRTNCVSVRTQATNYAAANLYEKSGFTLTRSDMSFRLTLDRHRKTEDLA